jgi:hypothetical protein
MLIWQIKAVHVNIAELVAELSRRKVDTYIVHVCV